MAHKTVVAGSDGDVAHSGAVDALKSVVFAMGERRADLEQAKTHKHQHQI